MTIEGSKELNDILKAIQKWTDKHKGNVQFIGSFCAFKGKEFEVIDDRILAYGLKDNIRLDIKEIQKMLEKEDKFVNW